MNAQEALRLLERLRREREVLESSFAEIMDEVEGTPVPDDTMQLYRWLYGIRMRLVEYDQLEREQYAVLVRLLGETIAGLMLATSAEAGPADPLRRDEPVAPA